LRCRGTTARARKLCCALRSTPRLRYTLLTPRIIIHMQLTIRAPLSGSTLGCSCVLIGVLNRGTIPYAAPGAFRAAASCTALRRLGQIFPERAATPRPWRGYTRLMPTVVSFAVGLGPTRAVPSAPARGLRRKRGPLGLRARRAAGSFHRGDDRASAFSRTACCGSGAEGAALFEPASGPAGSRPWGGRG
jgi:hypothetical protein